MTEPTTPTETMIEQTTPAETIPKTMTPAETIPESKTPAETIPKPMTPTERKRKQRNLDKANPNRKKMKLDTLFMFGEVEISVVVDKDRNVWFKGVDLARALEMESPSASIMETVSKMHYTHFEQLALNNIELRDIPNMQPKTIFVNETGMNLFVMRSRKPKAEAFALWVCGEVLPSIRKTGKYEIENPENNPYKELNDYLKLQNEELQSQNRELQSQNREKDSQLKEKDSQNRDKDILLDKLCSQQKDKDILLNKLCSQIMTMKPTCVPELENPLKKEYVIILRRPDTFYPYYCIRRQEHTAEEAVAELKEEYPTRLLKLTTPNSVNFYNFLLEHIPHMERQKGIPNSFRLKEPYGEDQFIRDVKNYYRTTYGVDCDATIDD